MQAVPLRINPGEELRQALESAVAAHNCEAAFVISGIGSLAAAQLRLAGATQTKALQGDLEILTLAGTICADGSHLHMRVGCARSCNRWSRRARLHRAHHGRSPSGFDA